jgi:outer membrane protein
MSAERPGPRHGHRHQRLSWPTLAAAILTLSAVPALAWNFPDLQQDPLLTLPPVLASGASLPGDRAPVSCPASVDLGAPLALGEVVDVALCNNPQIKESWAAIKIQAAGVGQARAAYLPTVSATVGHLYDRTRYPDFPVSNSSETGETGYLSLSWRLFDFGARAANREAANRLLTAALAGNDAALQKVLNAVVGAYFDALTARAALTAAQQTTQIAQGTYAATGRRERLGVAATSDTLQAATALAKAQLAASQAQGDAYKAVSTLVYAMGVPTGTTIHLPATVQAVPAQSIEELDELLRQARAQHPAIVVARAQWAAARAKVDAARDEGLPTLDFSANYYRNGYPNQGLESTLTNVATVGVQLTIPLFEGYNRTYLIRGAQAQAEQSQAQLEDTEHQVLTAVVQAHADALSALGNLQSSKNLLDAAQAALASSQRRYGKGATDILELLNAQAALADARQQRVRALAAWRSARLRLMASAGTLGRRTMDAQDATTWLPADSAASVP